MSLEGRFCKYKEKVYEVFRSPFGGAYGIRLGVEGCHSDVAMRSFHNDNLNSDLVPHRKVMDTLASTLNLDPTEQQLAGLGFNSTVRDELVVKVEGSFKRMLKIKF